MFKNRSFLMLDRVIKMLKLSHNLLILSCLIFDYIFEGKICVVGAEEMEGKKKSLHMSAQMQPHTLLVHSLKLKHTQTDMRAKYHESR